MDYFARLQQALAELDKQTLNRLLSFVRNCTGTLWLCGNGGSASTAQHWACDLSKKGGRRAQALGSNSALLTAWANDRDYALALPEEFRSVARPDDRLVCLSCSGTSHNITGVLLEAKHLGVACALVTGATRPAMHWLDAWVCVPSEDYGVIEDCHLAIGHWLTEELHG